MRGDLFINGKDAYDVWRLSLEPGAFLTLAEEYPAKPFIESNIRSANGRIVRNKGVKDYRTVQIMMHITGADTRDGVSKFRAFCNEIKNGFNLINRWDDNAYILDYKQCTPISNNNGLIKFNLTVLDNCSRSDAGVETEYDTPVVTLEYDDLSSLGGYARPKLSYSQKITKRFSIGSPVVIYQTTGAEVEWRHGAAAVQGTFENGVYHVSSVNIGERRMLIQSIAMVKMNGKTGTASFDVYQDGLGGSLLADSRMNLIADKNGKLITV